MLQKLDSLEEKYNEITELMSKPEIIGDPSQFQKYARAHSELDEIVLQYREYKSVLEQIKDTREMMAEEQEDEFRLMLEEEMDSLRDRKKQLEEKLSVPVSPLKKIILFLPGCLGWLINVPPFIIARKNAISRLKEPGHYDSVVMGILLLIYPLYVLLLTILLLLITHSWWSLLFPLVALFTAWAYVQIKSQMSNE